MPFLRGNWNIIVPYFISMIAPTVRRKGRPKIIGHEGSHSMSMIRKSTGTELSLTTIRTSSILPNGFFTEESTRRTPKEHGSKGFNSSISYVLLGKTEKKQNVEESVKNRPVGSKYFLGALLQLKSKKSEHTKVL